MEWGVGKFQQNVHIGIFILISLTKKYIYLYIKKKKKTNHIFYKLKKKIVNIYWIIMSYDLYFLTFSLLSL